jgi:hypothetical protein
LGFCFSGGNLAAQAGCVFARVKIAFPQTGQNRWLPL